MSIIKRFYMGVACMFAMLTFPAFSAGLPNGYTELEYITSDGDQLIDTGVIATRKTAVETKFINRSPSTDSTTRVVIGDSWSNSKFQLSITPQTRSFCYFGNQSLIKTDFWAANRLYTVRMDLNGVLINGTMNDWSSGTPGEFTSPKLYIFGVNDNSSRGTIVTMYYLRIYESGELVHNYVPAKRSDGVIGMYDTVGNAFLTNRRSGTAFTAGPVAGIKIATGNYLTQEVTPVKGLLQVTNGIIDGVISQSNTNTTNVGTLQSGKQTRPANSCPAGKKCLLVKDANNVDNWYEIVDCEGNAFLSDIGASVGAGSNPVSGPGKWCNNNYNSHAYTYPSCSVGEWGHLFANGMIYGQARAVSIAESTGAIVTLPDNVSVGDTCVCRVTGYAPLVSGSYAGGNPVYASSKTSFTTDKWFVAGRISTYYTNSNPPVSDSSCIDVCGFGDSDGAIKTSYCTNISNSCAGPVAQANMCNYYTFLDTVYGSSVVPQPHNLGFVVSSNEKNGSCASGGIYASTSHCTTPGQWISQYVYSQGNTVAGYVYGVAKAATVSSGTTAHSVIEVNLANLSDTVQSGNNAVVCVVQGYKDANNSTETNVSLNKVFVIDVNDNMTVGNSVAGWSRTCANAVSYSGNSEYTPAMNWYHELANMCVAY